MANSNREFFNSLCGEVLQECVASHTFDSAKGYLNELDEADRGDLLRFLFWESLRAGDWWIAEECIASGLLIQGDDVYDFLGEEPLHLSMDYFGDCPAIVEWLLNHGADIEARSLTCSNGTPLIHAVALSLTNVVKMLIRYGADINASTVVDNASTPLMIATMRDNRGIAELLLKHGADEKLKDRWGDDAISIGSRLGRSWMAELVRRSQRGIGPKDRHKGPKAKGQKDRHNR